MAVTKTFEHTLPFIAAAGVDRRFPIVVVTFFPPQGPSVDLPLLFDTGASVITLRHGFKDVVGARKWTAGRLGESATAGSKKLIRYYQYDVTVSLLGKTINNCPVNLMRMPENPLWAGLLGRAALVEQFGFGFWENAGELYVTTAP